MKVDVKIDMNGLEQKLHDIGPKIAKRTMRKSLKAVGTMWVDAVKARVPRDSGDLAASISMKMRTRPSDEGGSVTVGPAYTGKGKQDPGVYGMFVEFPLKSRPTFPTKPFMRPAFDATAEKAIVLFAETMKSNLEGL